MKKLIDSFGSSARGSVFTSAVGEAASENSPCSKGAGLIPVAFNLRASFADMSQQEPLLVSWSLSAWSLSP